MAAARNLGLASGLMALDVDFVQLLHLATTNEVLELETWNFVCRHIVNMPTN